MLGLVVTDAGIGGGMLGLAVTDAGIGGDMCWDCRVMMNDDGDWWMMGTVVTAGTAVNVTPVRGRGGGEGLLRLLAPLETGSVEVLGPLR